MRLMEDHTDTNGSRLFARLLAACSEEQERCQGGGSYVWIVVQGPPGAQILGRFILISKPPVGVDQIAVSLFCVNSLFPHVRRLIWAIAGPLVLSGCAQRAPTSVVVEFPSEVAFASTSSLEVLVYRSTEGCAEALDAALTSGTTPEFTSGEISVCDLVEEGTSVLLEEVGEDAAHIVALARDEDGTILQRGCVNYHGEPELTLPVNPTLEGLGVIEAGSCPSVSDRCSGRC